MREIRRRFPMNVQDILIWDLWMGENARRDIVLTMEDMGYGVEASHHEMAPAQHEIDLEYTEALDAKRQYYDI